MTVEFTFTTMRHNDAMLDYIRAALRSLDEAGGYKTTYREIDYDTGWAEFMRTALYGGSLDVSEMGSTWISDFVAMNALRSFLPAETRMLGGEEVFLPGLWRSGVSKHGVVYAIPWLTDLSLVYYRRSLLHKAGVDEATAFSTPEKFEQALASLSAAGVATPWVVPTRHSYITLHNIHIWLQHYGAGYVDETGKQVLLSGGSARSALRAYFGLHRYLSPAARGLIENDSDGLFMRGDAAITIGGPWVYLSCGDEIRADVGLAALFGKAYIGGSGLVIWSSCRDWNRALQLISRLTSQDVQLTLPGKIGMLPARLDVLDRFQFTGDTELDAIVVNALRDAEPLPIVPLWGMIEDRLTKAFASLWAALLSSEEPDLDGLLDQIITPTVDRLNLVLAGS